MSETFHGSTSGDGNTVRGFACAGQPGASKDSDCCDDGQAWVRLMCQMICQMCCMTCTLGPLKVNGVGGDKTPEDEEGGTPSTTPGTIPTTTPIDGELQFTDSSYGAGLPIVFGSDLLDGNVIWRGPVVKNKFTKDDKEYYYNTVSFALGICEGQINGALRVFIGDRVVINNTANVDDEQVPIPNANGYIAGASVDLTDAASPLRNIAASKRATKITVYNGSTAQLPDPAMSAADGFDLTPGYRNLAYVMIENLIVENSIPLVRVEVTANTVNLYPRLYGGFDRSEEALFDNIRTQFLGYDPTYDIVYMSSYRDGTGENIGFTMLDGNTLQVFHETAVIGPDSDGVIPFINQNNTHILTNGLLLIDASEGNSGEYYTYNPFSDTTVSGPFGGGGVGGHDGTGLARTLLGSTAFRARGRKGLTIDILGSPGFAADAAVGFAEIDGEGKFTPGGYVNSIMDGPNVRMVYYPITDEVFADAPTFEDGGTTAGLHTYSFGWGSSEKNRFKIVRASISETANASVAAPIFTEVGTLDFDLLGGVGAVHSIARAFFTANDSCIVLMIRVTGRDDRMVKYNPISDTLVWNKPMPADFPTLPQPDENGQMIYGSDYLWLSNDNKIYRTDLSNGATEAVIEDFDAQDLPTPVGGLSYYNGLEGSLMYTSVEPGKEIVKVFCAKFNRAQAPISTIITKLLERVGWNNFSTKLDDLQALAIDGYTVYDPTQLRSVFADLKQVFRFDIIESNGTITYKTRGTPATVNIEEKELGNGTGEEGWLKITHDNDLINTRKLNLTYRDLNRDYKQNVQSIQLPNYTGQRIDNDAGIDVTVPIVLTADDAKQLAEILLYSKLVYETSYEGVLGPKYQTLDPGDVAVIMDGEEEVTVRMRDIAIGQDRTVEFIATKEDPDIYEDQVNLFGNTGQYDNDGFDAPAKRIDPLILEIPFRTGTEASSTNSSYLFFLTLLNLRVSTVPEATLSVQVDGARRYGVPMPTTFPTWGYVTEALDDHPSFASTDTHSTMRVKMMSTSGAELADAPTLEDLIDNERMNLCYVNGELLQFKNVVNEGSGVYAFSVFNRAKQGTEPKSLSHAPGERFVLLADHEGTLDTTSIRQISVAIGESPRKAIQVFVKTNNPFQPQPISYWYGLNMRPQIVGALEGFYRDDDLYLQWDYRARYNGEWPDDGAEGVPFTDGTEEYTVFFLGNPETFRTSDPTTYYRRFVVNTPGIIYSLEQQLADGFDNLSDTMYVFVTQSGSITGKDPGAASTTIVYPQT